MHLRNRAGMCGSLCALLIVCAADTVNAQERLGSYDIDPDKISVAGISSGAFMANQFHIAHSELITGAGLVAGGLYACAVVAVDESDGELDATLTRALDRCMAGKALDGVEKFKARTEQFAQAGWIDPLSGLVGDRVYLFTGRADDVVAPETVKLAAEVYSALGIETEALKHMDRALPGEGAGHAWLTEHCCQPCGASASPYINDCDYDQAGDILNHVYGELQPKAETPSGRLLEFSQKEFVVEGKTVVNGLGDRGFVYLPKACAEGETCALHVVFHGCRQSTEVLEETFVNEIGVNEWADSNNIIVLYPQANSVSKADLDEAFPGSFFSNAFQVNPRGCWNWWGYAHDKRFPLKDGVQISAIRGMIERITGGDGE